MDSILEPFPAERLFPAAGTGFLDFGDFSEADFLSNVHFSENLDHLSDNMEDFSNDLFSSFFDDPVLAEKNPLLDMDLDPPTPGIQAEHSYSLSGDSAPQSPLVPVKTEDNANELENGVWSLGPKLCSIMVKQEQNLALDLPESQLAASSIPVLNLNPLQRLPVPEEMTWCRCLQLRLAAMAVTATDLRALGPCLPPAQPGLLLGLLLPSPPHLSSQHHTSYKEPLAHCS